MIIDFQECSSQLQEMFLKPADFLKLTFISAKNDEKGFFFLTTNKMFREMFKGRESLSVFCSVTFHRAGIEQLLFISSIFWQGFYIIWQSDPVGDY